MGWNEVRQEGHPLWTGIPQYSRFYFVHSYYVEPAERSWWRAACEYGVEFAACALARGNLFAVQFHPEKSHTAGLQLLANFVAWNGRARSAHADHPRHRPEGRACVRLRQGLMDDTTVFGDDPVAMAARWVQEGAGACIWWT